MADKTYSVGTLPPTHTAPANTRYFDTKGQCEYINTDGATNWIPVSPPRKWDYILAAQTASGNADFFTRSGLNLTLKASTSTPFIYDVAMHRHRLTADQVLAVTDAVNNFIWIDDTETLGVATLPPVYSYTAPGAPATGQHWYDLGARVMNSWSGAAWVAVSRIFIGYVRADGGNIDARYLCSGIDIDPYDRLKMFGDGSDGFLEASAGTTTIDGTKQYSFVVVRNGANLQHTGNSRNTPPLTIYSQGGVAIIGSSTINLTSLAGAGGAGAIAAGAAGLQGALGGSGGGGGGGTSAGGLGGSLWRAVDFTAGSGGAAGTALGGAGGNGVAGTHPASGGIRVRSFGGFGASGGGGGGDGVSVGADATRGGGSIGIFTESLAVGGGSSITAGSSNGNNSAGNNRGGGSSGGGGVIELGYRNLFNSGSITANAGTAGTGGTGAGAGGVGGAGVVASARM